MNDIFILWLPLSISLAAFVGLIVVLVAVVRGREDQRKLLAVLEQLRGDRSAIEKTNHLAEQFTQLKSQLANVAQHTEAVGNKSEDLEQQLGKVAHRQTALEQQILQQQEAIQEVAEQDPESKFYQRAARLVQQGASLEEVMEACELPRAEAELLYSLYKK